MTAKDDIDDSSAPLVEHLAELRNRLIWSVGAFLVAMVLCFIVAEPILDFMLAPIEEAMRALGNPNPVMQYTAPQEYFFTLMHIAMVGGLMLSFPVIAYQLWRFVAPGLYRSEKQAFLPFLIASPVMFFLGAAFAYYVILPLAFTFFLGFQQGGLDAADAANEMAAIGFQGSVQEYLSLTIKFVMAFGICFQLPVLLSLMGKAGLVSAKGLAGMRKYAVVAILVVAAVATPPDVISQVILFTVVYGLYEVSIQLVARIEAARKKRMIAEGTWFEDEDLEAEFDEDEDEAGGKA